MAIVIQQHEPCNFFLAIKEQYYLVTKVKLFVFASA